MTTADKIKLIDDLINEDANYTVKDYLDVLADIDWVAAKTEKRLAAKVHNQYQQH